MNEDERGVVWPPAEWLRIDNGTLDVGTLDVGIIRDMMQAFPGKPRWFVRAASRRPLWWARRWMGYREPVNQFDLFREQWTDYQIVMDTSELLTPIPKMPGARRVPAEPGVDMSRPDDHGIVRRLP